MNNYYPIIIITVLISAIILWVCVRSIRKTWRNNRHDEQLLTTKLEAILSEAISKAEEQQPSDNVPEDDAADTDSVTDEEPADPTETKPDA